MQDLDPIRRARPCRAAGHFAASATREICGLHVTSPGETCRVTVVDIDAHGDGDDPAANLAMALGVLAEALAAGFDARLFDSNGRGGYHIWIFHGAPVRAAAAFRLGKWLAREPGRFGLTKAQESFPKAPRLSGKGIGGFVRLPGRHHKGVHYTRVWDDAEGRWLAGEEAIDSILRARGAVVDIASVVPADFDAQPGKAQWPAIPAGPVEERGEAGGRRAGDGRARS